VEEVAWWQGSSMNEAALSEPVSVLQLDVDSCVRGSETVGDCWIIRTKKLWAKFDT